jgi:hypothetical protein
MTIERIQLRRGTAAQWTDTNPILGAAEVGVELGTPNKFKIGDGSSTWIELAYFVDEDSIPEVDLTGYATETFVTTAIGNLVDSAPSTLDTLNELALALGEDPDFAATIVGALGDKADVSHTHTIGQVTGLDGVIGDLESTDFAYGTRLDSLEAGAEFLDTRITSLESAPSPTPEVFSTTDTQIDLQSFFVNKIVSVNSASNVDFYILDALSPGESVVVYNKNVGIITFYPAGSNLEGAGVSNVNLKLSNRYSSVTIFCESPGVYAIIGDVEIA